MTEQQLTPLDDRIAVPRDDLITVLRWVEQQPTSVMVTGAELRLQHELMTHPDPNELEHDHEEDDEVPGWSCHRAAAVAVLVCSLLVLAGAGIAWLLVVTGP